MKKLIMILPAIVFLVQGFGQNTSSARDSGLKKTAASDSSDAARLILGKDLIRIEDDREALRIRVGNRGVTILESLEAGERRICFDDYRRDGKNDEEALFTGGGRDNMRDEGRTRRLRFRGHWAGVEAGFNNYLTPGNSLNLPENIDYMSLHSGKSRFFNANVAQTSLGLTRRIGFVTGLGINWNNYRFDGNNNIIKLENGEIEKYDPELLLKRSKFSTLYLTLPLLLEVQIPANYSQLSIAAGPIGAVKLYSYSKMVFDNGDKVRSEDDFSLNMLRYGATLRIGFGNFQVFGTSYFMPLFQTGKSPGGVDLYPFEVGISFTID
ncbi:MAG TPA: outer membrane beta-barrel protein [Bacteroidales bacterium]|nr:outer membrane beta-barrel protein [Bacteroidales bacterium]HQH23135.1 outer membrane beta-barrel protein [Bacteroidales bacterium]HQJ81007.1 outer membrane beta-barrel protein [Bacteroidales bacterium]